MALYCIKKDRNFLTYRDQFNDSHTCEISELHFSMFNQWHWTTEEDRSKVFTSQREAESFIAERYGEFFRGAEVILFKL
ncbi:hypothetical protein E0H80_08125 [Acinetobacter sp. ANC 4779]|uniref:hypothetical protein n=1 Tax=Acinetobacter sp. ANC 4779 TaxID=2529848 RepID=UPI0007D83FF1|nr:hypothetical protein [Acinetobacter sp. ANC 4779]OAL79128.1 hypothetical protein AY606_06790 [Acinetobacter sp. SFB]TCB50781.1 hypothetical protein E0H80_08125 [Acinetobacter sp. ANC 4779]